MIWTIIFVVCAALLIYILVIYPALVLLLGLRKTRTIQPRWPEPPPVAMLLSAYNEEASIARKLQNALAQDYPEDKLDIVVVDDGSTDRTCQIVRGFQSPRITLLQQERRRGKTAALNRAAAAAKGAVLIFTDANAIYRPDAVRRLVSSFDAEGKIGVVCGELKYQQHPDAVSDEESRYWDLEIRLKKAESNLNTLLGANGSIYALRRELFQPLNEDLISDFIGPLLLSRKGYRTVYQPLALSIESSTRSLGSEFRRKKRIVQRGLYGLWMHRELLNPFASQWLAIQLWSHKVLRWFLPVWLLGLLIGSATLSRYPFFRILCALQLLAYLCGIVGIAIQASGKKTGALRLPGYGLMILTASLAGIWGFLRGRKVITWEPQR